MRDLIRLAGVGLIALALAQAQESFGKAKNLSAYKKIEQTKQTHH